MKTQKDFFQAVSLRPSINTYKKGAVVCAKNGYTYTLSENPGCNFAEDFKPVFTPIQMLEMGVFEGKYLNDSVSEFPREYFEKAKVSLNSPNEDVNYFGIKSRQPLSVWNENGWIHSDDGFGWFQWYCRYYLGRRTEDDARQIKRWKAFARHAGQIKKNCPGQLDKRIRQRQALLQWSYDPFI